jgi:uncharacterized SAM-binding protein YcdF (DUF218 family)
MFFYLSKILGFFAIPSNLVILIGIAGALLLRSRFRRAGWRLVVGSLIILAIIGLSPIGNALIIPLEDRFPPWDATRGAPDGIVVLGGAISPDVSAARGVPALTEAAERMTAAVELARRYPNARILFSGGTGELVSSGATEAEAARRLWEALGIDASRIIIEDKSRNTVENAVFSRELVKPKPSERWLLVTSAYHMPRAVGIFRKAGFPAEPYPVDWRTRGPEDALRPFATLGDGLRRTDTAVREWVGLVIYWLTGRSSELFPGPIPGSSQANSR